MPVAVFRDDVRRLVGDEKAQLVEVLPPRSTRTSTFPGLSISPSRS
jgi:hypothetical protein